MRTFFPIDQMNFSIIAASCPSGEAVSASEHHLVGFLGKTRASSRISGVVSYHTNDMIPLSTQNTPGSRKRASACLRYASSQFLQISASKLHLTLDETDLLMYS